MGMVYSSFAASIIQRYQLQVTYPHKVLICQVECLKEVLLRAFSGGDDALYLRLVRLVAPSLIIEAHYKALLLVDALLRFGSDQNGVVSKRANVSIQVDLKLTKRFDVFMSWVIEILLNYILLDLLCLLILASKFQILYRSYDELIHSIPTDNNNLVNMEMHVEPGIQTRTKRNPGIRTKKVNAPANKRSKKTSKIWEHFTIETVGPGCKRACCKQCKKSFAYINSYKVVGTSHFKRHIAKGGCSVLLRNQGQDQDTPTLLSKMVRESSAAPTTDLPVLNENNALVIYEPVDLGIQTNDAESPPAKRRRKKSMVWEHFTIETVSPGCKRACCKQCKQSFAYSMGSKVAGTSHLKRHIAKDGCPMVRNRNQNQNGEPLSEMAHESSVEEPTQDERIASLEAEVRRLGEELREVKRVLREAAPP
ncbi:uncharacterized protein LOC143629596 [Bidens hawaiensis]|uniref:uncharacterized protein LOC143629596 n=1 Tax=Bidens hawaiensis TaxID=980011 RepID=UPI0040494D1B